MKTVNTQESIVTLIFNDSDSNELKRSNYTLGYDLSEEQYEVEAKKLINKLTAENMINDCVEIVIL